MSPTSQLAAETRSAFDADWELERVAPLWEASRRLSLSADTIKRQYPDWIVWLSPGRRGMKVKHIHAISERRK